MDEVICCGRCGRKLRSAQTVEIGFGRVCYEKDRLERVKAEYERNQQKLFEWDMGGIILKNPPKCRNKQNRGSLI